MPPAEPTIQSQPQLPPPAAADQTETGNEEEADPGPDPEPGPTTEQEKQTPAAAAAATPVVPGPRATRLQQLFASVAKRTLDKIDADNFGACFPTIRDKAPRTLEAVQRQMVERLGSLWNKEFDAILANRQVVARLNELEDLVADAARRRREAGGESGEPPVAPHTLPADTILDAHLQPHLASHRSQLNAKLQNMQAANAKLYEEIQAQRAEIETLLKGVEKMLADVDGANGLLGEVVEELAVETRAADSELESARSAMAGR